MLQRVKAAQPLYGVSALLGLHLLASHLRHDFDASLESRVVRSPSSCCANLYQFPFVPHFVSVLDLQFGVLRMSMVDEGPVGALAVVMIHGNPTWSYMWRRLIPPIVNAGYRAIAVDLIGMGRSDKLIEPSAYSISRHVAWLRSVLFRTLKLERVCFLLTDWGSIIGQRLMSDQLTETRGVILMNAAPLCYNTTPFDSRPPPKYTTCGDLQDGSIQKDICKYQQELISTGGRWDRHWDYLASLLAHQPPDPRIVEGYAAPYPDPIYTSANTRFILTIPTLREDRRMQIANWMAAKRLQSFKMPHLVLLSEHDGIMGELVLEGTYSCSPWYVERPPIVINGTNHFLLEDKPELVVRLIVAFLTTKLSP